MSETPGARTGNWSHGASGYSNHGCRCDACRAGHAEYQRGYLQRRKKRTGERIVHGRFVAPAEGSAP